MTDIAIVLALIVAALIVVYVCAKVAKPSARIRESTKVSLDAVGRVIAMRESNGWQLDEITSGGPRANVLHFSRPA